MSENLANMGSSQTVSNSGHLVDYEFVPGVIVETNDPLKYGRIKVTALGAYNANNSTMDQLPWCYPFMMMGNNTYTSYERGSKVWLLRNKKRNDENWFIPMYEQHAMTSEFISGKSDDDKAEVLSMRSNGGNQSSITYDNSGGYNISCGGSTGDASVNVGTDSTTTVTGGSSSVVTNNSGVQIGASDGTNVEPAVLGNQLKSLLENILGMLREFCDELISQDYLACGAAFNLQNKLLNTIAKADIDKILSQRVTISEGSEQSTT